MTTIDTVDTSVAVPLMASWHESHDLVRAALRGRAPRIGAHVAVETFSVLTRLPAQRRISPSDAWALLRSGFDGSWLALPAPGHRLLVERLSEAGVGGGAVYDGLVAATAVHHRARLISLDRRAQAVYERLGVEVELLRESV
ncbi:MAG: type II toxin-antitoxin system VapC family toxin [Acidimicrobiales bacterium]